MSNDCLSGHDGVIADLQAQVKERDRQLAAVVEALGRYGDHDPACTLMNVAAGRRAANCSCGFDVALCEMEEK